MAKTGGSWKVAYADFMTAMMAFFLVMWIAGQDQKIKQAVARYFNNPMGLYETGASERPDKTGAIFDLASSGDVPKSQSVALGRGRHSYTRRGERSPATKMVGDWLHADAKAYPYWREQARLARDAASQSREAREHQIPADEVAARHLARQLRYELTRDAPPTLEGVYQELLYAGLSAVNWTEIAEDLLAQ